VLSTLFLLLTVLMYVGYAKRHKIAREHGRVSYFLTLLFFLLGLMAKPMLVTLPFVLLLLDYWPLRRLELGKFRRTLRPLVLEKIPFFVLAAASSAILSRTKSSAPAN